MTSKQPSNRNKSTKNFKLVQTIDGFSEYRHTKNKLTVLHYEIPGTNVISTNVTYRVGARDEGVGETGIAHMLEHMMFKPTKHDLKRKHDSASMKFEREIGVILNANTWKDRTTYFFSYPKEHFVRALTIEAERMRDLVISDKEFLPERTNVLSEYDMYNGHPEFALEVGMCTTAFTSHPYGHETIGFREDIAAYTTPMLQKFYDTYYQPNNATIIVVGDCSAHEALASIDTLFGVIPEGPAIPRNYPSEPAQEGLRRFEMKRPSTTNIVSLGVKHPGSADIVGWIETVLAFRILASGPDSILYQKFYNTGKVTEIRASVEPTMDRNLATLALTLSPGNTHTTIEKAVREAIANITLEDLTPHLKKVVNFIVHNEAFDRDSSLKIALDLTEYVSAGIWPEYLNTKKNLSRIKPKDILNRLHTLFAEETLTVGHFIGTNT